MSWDRGRRRLAHECWDVRLAILGRGPFELQQPREADATDNFFASVSVFVKQLRAERDGLLEQIIKLERECEGLKLALARTEYAKEAQT